MVPIVIGAALSLLGAAPLRVQLGEGDPIPRAAIHRILGQVSDELGAQTGRKVAIEPCATDAGCHATAGPDDLVLRILEGTTDYRLTLEGPRRALVRVNLPIARESEWIGLLRAALRPLVAQLGPRPARVASASALVAATPESAGHSYWPWVFVATGVACAGAAAVMAAVAKHPDQGTMIRVAGEPAPTDDASMRTASGALAIGASVSFGLSILVAAL